LPITLARFKPGGNKREVAFEFADGACSLATAELRNLYYGGLVADT